MTLSVSMRNRIGFAILGLTNNFSYVIMLSAAYDLLKIASEQPINHPIPVNSTTEPTNNTQEAYCNPHSTSTILLADTLPSLATKVLYPFLLVQVPLAAKAIATAILAALAFIITSLSTREILIFIGVISASFSSGLGETTFLSNSNLYGDVALSGWSIGTGGAGLLGAGSYILLTMILPIKYIMMVMLIVPVGMLIAFFYIIQPTYDNKPSTDANMSLGESQEAGSSQSILQNGQVKFYNRSQSNQQLSNIVTEPQLPLVTLKDKILYLPSLAKYFLPLLLVYYGEYFINQGLFELVYYPEITFLSHAAQYRWFQFTYQFGVFLSRSSLDLFRIKNIWLMSLLQLTNAILFLCHAAKLIHIPSFYIVILLIAYEGLLGGFTYVNAFYRVKKEVPTDKVQFSVSAVTIADSLGIVFAGLSALPVHDSLCKLYQ